MTTPQWALDKIQEAKERQITQLNISGFQESVKLKQFPVEIFDLPQLTELDISSNQLTSLPESIAQLKNLIVLNLAINQLASLPESIAKLQNLISLNLGGNKFASLPGSISELQNLSWLYLRGNRLVDLPESIVRLRNLTSLVLMENQFTNFSESITKLHKLTNLDLSFNQLISLPESIAELQNLIKLDLAFNQLVSLPSSITRLRTLNTLKLEDNPLSIPPQEVVKKGVESIREYFRQLEEQGQDLLYEAKLIILGEGGAGKTTLSKKIENSYYELQEEEKTTEGVDVTQWSFPVENERLFRVNIWDFGGQEIYHATHQFFLTRRSLYILVADTRKEDTDFYYWLNVVDLLSDNSPLLIVKNEKQDRHREINERQLRGQFGNLKEILAANLATNRGLDFVKEDIKHYIKNLPHIGSPLPKTWVRVRERLEKDLHNYISLEDYLIVCRENGFMQTRDSLQLSDYLHDIGVFLHFQDDPVLNKTVILKPKWGTDAVYKVLDNKLVIKNLGRFTRADLKMIWNEPEYEYMRGELLQLMMKFKLCYEIPGQTGVYIAPQLLTENQPDYKWNDEENLLLRYTYEFMPKGILLQFIVAMSENIWKQNVWKSGVVLENEKTYAEVIEFYGKRQIYLRVAGPHKKELMTIAIHELDRIHKTYKRLKYDKLIPCNCKDCRINVEPHFYKHEQLQNFIEKRLDEIQCGTSGNMVSVRGLIDDVVGWRPEKELEVIMANQKPLVSDGINIGDYFSGTIITGTVKSSFNKLESAGISGELKETLKQLAQAVDALNKELPPEKSKKVAKYYNELVDQAIEETPDPEWYNVSVNGLIKAADNIGEVGGRVVNLSKKVLSILIGGIL